MQDLVTPLLSLYKSLSTVEKSGNFGKHGFSFAYFAFSDRTKQHIFPTKNTAKVCVQAMSRFEKKILISGNSVWGRRVGQ